MADQVGEKDTTSLNTVSTNSVLIKIIFILGLIYVFILSITLLGEAFKLFGKPFSDALMSATSNPMVGLLIGILSTAIIQSSSTTTSTIVIMVASGTLPFEAAIPMVMGANIGTTITCAIVSLGHFANSDEYRRAFAAASLHDFFNICSVIVLFPLQVSFNIIGKSAMAVEHFFLGFEGVKFHSPLKAITKPVAEQIISLTGHNAWLLVIISFILLFIALSFIVKTLKTLVLARVEQFFQRYIFRNAIIGFVLGLMLTLMVQSSSITTSLVVPLVGAGVLSLIQIYPYCLGANVGTTITAFLASFVTGSHIAVSVAFAHLFFNIYGIFIFWPLRRIPIFLAKSLSKLTMKSRLVPVIYILVVFFLIPGIIVYFME